MKIIYVNCRVRNYIKVVRSSQLYMQLLQLRKESLKKIQACTGFEPLTSAILVQRSFQMSYQANWEQIVELIRYKPVKG